MSWTKRLNHPSEVLTRGDQIEVQVLNINEEKQEISLGMKQALPNPWEGVAEKYPPRTVISGVVRNLANYGAFVEIEDGIDGLLHVSDMSWVRKVSHPSEILHNGEQLTCMVLAVDQEGKRVALGLKQMIVDPWEGDIPGRYRPGDTCKGKVTKLTNFGVFVELEPGLEGLLHITEMADQPVQKPEDVTKVGEEIEVRIVRVDREERRIGLSRKQTLRTDEDGEAEGEGIPRERWLRRQELGGGTGRHAGRLFPISETLRQQQDAETGNVGTGAEPE
jgi:small subunit ribosomal protein S1